MQGEIKTKYIRNIRNRGQTFKSEGHCICYRKTLLHSDSENIPCATQCIEISILDKIEDWKEIVHREFKLMMGIYIKKTSPKSFDFFLL